jgi:hypothetical protein
MTSGRGRSVGDAHRRAIENAMLVHAAFGGSTDLLIHVPAYAHAAGLDAHGGRLAPRQRIRPRLVDAGRTITPPCAASRARAGDAHLRRLGSCTRALTVTGRNGQVLDDGGSEQARCGAARRADGVDPTT